jgi:N-acetylneuraminic acid mutarotase
LGYNNSEGYKKDFWEYDPSIDSWNDKANFARKARSAAAGFALYKKGYIGTGTDGTNLYKDFWEYDPATNTWKQVADYTGEAGLCCRIFYR